ncbi:hypothetical protein D0B54_22530 [Solimonas sp. K1W22B-7]|uniref:efflux RND transporter periplasmic adaptor subunit n=1 Tax=Solimonas sp. K1W22B-7 TaxID=2303331 RepID=UPI000E33022D|nr:hypothetical protein [Solimonas sp. K1W22B-7]AXQ31287.1 hypothetical protein D0B54_22530 [Solimonas sp. K1W22B-7]
MKPCAAGLLLCLPLLALAAPAERVVLLDKAEQRRLQIRTQRADAPRPPELLPARVVVDPRRHLRVMSGQAGTLEAPPSGFAVAGDSVAAGQLLGWLRPAITAPQRRDLESERVGAERDVALGRLQIDRYSIDEAENLDVRLPTPSIQVLTDYRVAKARQDGLRRALDGRIALHAPASAIVLRSSLRAGRVAGEGETLMELNSEGGLAVELLFDGGDYASAQADTAWTLAGEVLKLHFLGETLDPASRSRRVLYAASGAGVPLAVGQPLRLRLPVAAGPGWVLPARSIDRSGGQWVWLHQGAERFVRRAVSATPLAEGWVRIDSVLEPASRVVVDGLSSLAAAS